MLEDKFSKEFLERYFQDITAEFEVDAVGLWQIVYEQKALQLTNEEMDEFLFKLIIHMVNIGAKPVVSDKDLWCIQTKYGVTPEEIATNVVKEWRQNQNTEDSIDDVGGLWFATKNVYDEKTKLHLMQKSSWQQIKRPIAKFLWYFIASLLWLIAILETL